MPRTVSRLLTALVAAAALVLPVAVTAVPASAVPTSTSLEGTLRVDGVLTGSSEFVEAGKPYYDVYVNAYAPGDLAWESSARVRSDGTWSITGLRAGVGYELQVACDGLCVGGWNYGTRLSADRTGAVTSMPGSTVSLSSTKGQTIAGSVVYAPVQGYSAPSSTTVIVSHPSPSGPVAIFTNVRADGTFSASGIEPGMQYTVIAYPQPSGNAAMPYLGGSWVSDDADLAPVSVPGAKVTGGAVLTLRPAVGRVITGSATRLGAPVPYVGVEVYFRVPGGKPELVRGYSAGKDGTFAVTTYPASTPGATFLRFDGVNLATKLSSGWANTVDGTAGSFADATDVTGSRADVAMAGLNTISGKVTAPPYTSALNIVAEPVDATQYDFDVAGRSLSAPVAGDGSFTLANLNGVFTYRLRVEHVGDVVGYFTSPGMPLTDGDDVGAAGTISSSVSGLSVGGYRTFDLTSAPVVTGTAKVGAKLTATPGTWTLPVTASYQWLRDGTAIAGATSSTYTPTAAELGHSVAVRVAATAADGRTKTSTSAPTAAVVAGTFTPLAPAVLGGTPKVGSKLTVSGGAWTPTPSTLTYQWLRAGVVISGANAATYTPVAADLGKVLSVRVSATRTGFTSSTTTLTASKAVVAGAFTNLTQPKTSGAVKVGSVVSATAGTWSPAPTTVTYQWLRDSTPITGATKSTYTPVATDLGKGLAVKVTVTRAGYTNSSLARAAGVVARGTLTKTPTPKVTGTAKVGQRLTATAGTWDSGVTLKYQWHASGTAIKGATGRTLTVPKAVRGKTLTVTVTGSKAGYTTVTKRSVATAKVS